MIGLGLALLSGGGCADHTTLLLEMPAELAASIQSIQVDGAKGGIDACDVALQEPGPASPRGFERWIEWKRTEAASCEAPVSSLDVAGSAPSGLHAVLVRASACSGEVLRGCAAVDIGAGDAHIRLRPLVESCDGRDDDASGSADDRQVCAWSLVSPRPHPDSVLAEVPPARFAHSAVFDPVAQRWIVIGGDAQSATPGCDIVATSEVFVLDRAGGCIQKMRVRGDAPSGRAGFSAVWDGARERVLVFGGESCERGRTTVHGELWGLRVVSAATVAWSRLEVAGDLEPRAWHAAAWAGDDVGLLLQGGRGEDGAPLDSAVRLAPEGERFRAIALPPSVPRWSHAGAWLPEVRGFAIHGGFTTPRRSLTDLGESTPRSADTWLLDVDAGAWRSLTARTSTSPAARAQHVVAAHRGSLLVHGGLVLEGGAESTSSETLRGTLESGGIRWERIATSSVSPAVRLHAAAVDPSAGGALLVAGGRRMTSPVRSPDLWELPLDRADAWRRITDAGRFPPHRGMAGFAQDARNRRLYVDGGVIERAYKQRAPADDTWIYDFTFDDADPYSFGRGAWCRTWAGGERGPPPRAGGAAIVDRRGRLVVYGGFTATSTVSILAFGDPAHFMADVWALDADTRRWSLLWAGERDRGDARDTKEPGGRVALVAVHDPTSDRLIFHGGFRGLDPFQDLWAFDLTSLTWDKLSFPGPGPSARGGAVLVLDPTRRRLLLFGGASALVLGREGFHNDVWAFDLERRDWTELWPDRQEGGPAVRAGAFGYYDRWLDRLVIGYGLGADEMRDVWAFDVAQRRWQQVQSQEVSPNRPYAQWAQSAFFVEGQPDAALEGSRNARLWLYGGLTRNFDVLDAASVTRYHPGTSWVWSYRSALPQVSCSGTCEP